MSWCWLDLVDATSRRRDGVGRGLRASTAARGPARRLAPACAPDPRRGPHRRSHRRPGRRRRRGSRSCGRRSASGWHSTTSRSRKPVAACSPGRRHVRSRRSSPTRRTSRARSLLAARRRAPARRSVRPHLWSPHPARRGGAARPLPAALRADDRALRERAAVAVASLRRLGHGSRVTAPAGAGSAANSAPPPAVAARPRLSPPIRHRRRSRIRAITDYGPAANRHLAAADERRRASGTRGAMMLTAIACRRRGRSG